MEANRGHCITDDMDPLVHIKLSGVRCDKEGWFDYETRLTHYRVGTIHSLAGNQEPGRQIPEARFRVGNAHIRNRARHCDFTGTDCWYVKTHPMIESIDRSDGYTTGGQTLTINGWGLKGVTTEDVEVTVDGVACEVQSHGKEQIVCKTGAADAISQAGVSQPGSPGLHQIIRDPEDSDTNTGWNTRTDGVHPIVETKLLTTFENNP